MVERAVPVSIQDIVWKDLWFAMGYKGEEPEQGIQEMAEALVEEMLPGTMLRYAYRVVEARKLSPSRVMMDGKEFTTNGIISSYLGGMTHACVFLATAGEEFNATIRKIRFRDDIFAEFVADSLGTLLAELAVSRLEEDLRMDKGLSLPYSPGYCDWDISEQKLFFTLFPELTCGITLSESFLMSPEKSVSGFFAMGEKLQRQPYHCAICRNERCYKRKTR